MIKRRKTRTIRLGNVEIGGDAPVSVQSMTTTRTEDISATVAQIRELHAAGCQIVRVAVPNDAAAAALARIKAAIHLPLVADIHFSHLLALQAIAQGVDGLRINPGNMRNMDAVRQVVCAAGEKNIPIRIGVNSGSILKRHGLDVEPPAESLCSLMVDTALEYCDFFETLGFRAIKLSLKASDVPTTMEACRQVAHRCDYPLHLGVTAAGTYDDAVVPSAVGIGGLLSEGIGDTIRVSITGPPALEVAVGIRILKSLGLRPPGLRLVSCPTCGRCEIDLPALVEQVRRRLPDALLSENLEVAIMGCVVNGPGEAAMADFGIAGGRGFGFVFQKGMPPRKVPEQHLADELLKHILSGNTRPEGAAGN
ncbi:MAG TPA: flavodoxin-dependent (E)-4-hydroxy-3-methylbut-2-enyl-diphosphate synthase [Planctomycetota bacterium]|nr:flavodoxin-dependent (E)-4-hydroxy-3-methylbut-2-enyl-diphosphate synthase [Planctomycetota bacterium]